jgi:hypothetical protein
MILFPAIFGLCVWFVYIYIPDRQRAKWLEDPAQPWNTQQRAAEYNLKVQRSMWGKPGPMGKN